MLSLIPEPSVVDEGAGVFTLDDDTKIVAPASLARLVALLQAALRPATGLRLTDAEPLGETITLALNTELGASAHRLVSTSDGIRIDGGDETGVHAGIQTLFGLTDAKTPGKSITLSVDPKLGASAYRLTSSPDGINIDGGDETGVYAGIQTLLQLLPPAIYRRAPVRDTAWTVPAVTIQDAPRFPWRGAMLDVARHFMPKHDVLRFIDLMAMHKLNTLHWHLTEDQGWRIEIKRYPLLTSVGSWRKESQVGAGLNAPTDGRPHGGFYTQDDIREIVAYAGARHIDVVPEIDVPGHSLAAIAAYPELGVGSADRPVAELVSTITH